MDLKCLEEQKMGSTNIEEKIKVGGGGGGVLGSGVQTSLLEEMKLLKEIQHQSGTLKAMNWELWYACAGPLVSLPHIGSLVYYFPQGHSEQVAASTRTATSQIPNYPNLPSQLLCQVHSVTLHADRDTDEIYAQMSLQPVISNKDVFPIPDFGFKQNKHPTEFFCKTLTASDTSTHGGFSVPRRAAEKLFPPLDYTSQPPTQELVVRDLHDNTWTFRHIYRGQPKRHLLTTGWSLFVGSKRLKAGDSVLFIRDEKSQLLVGVRRANRQQTTLPSSVLSADSMHIGVLAAAAHAAANRSPFTIFYNPRACPAEFVIPLSKFRKAVYGTQLSVGMRFGMMFETEESGKRRYMGTIVGISDLDPLRWRGSKWRSLQVEWDEPGCSDKQNRVSPWEIETPESLFIFPSLTSGLKRPMHSSVFGAETEWANLVKRPLVWFPGSRNGNLCSSERLIGTLTKPPQVQNPVSCAPEPQEDLKIVNITRTPKPNQSEIKSMEKPTNSEVQNLAPASSVEKSKVEHDSGNQLNQLSSTGECHNPKPSIDGLNQQNQNEDQAQLCPVQSLLDSSVLYQQPQQVYLPQVDLGTLNGSVPFLDNDEWMSQASSCMSLPGMYRPLGLQDSSVIFTEPTNPSLPLLNQDEWDQQLKVLRSTSCGLNPTGVRDWSDESNSQSGVYGSLNVDTSAIIDPSTSSVILDELCTSKDVDFPNPSNCLFTNFGSSQDIQSQITSASLADSQAFSHSSGGTSLSNLGFDKSSTLLQNSSWPQAGARARTYTKVQKVGSVGRSIDVSGFKNYEQLCSAIECMFGLEGLLNNPRESGWKLVYVDYENDVLLIGDDPWEEFVGCVRCIRILSPTEVHQMSEEGMKLLNNASLHGIISEGTS